MSISHCALSGETLSVPVVSTKSGHVFEKSLIEKHILNTGQCPLTGVDLSIHDFIPLKVPDSVRPKPHGSNSVPSILTLLQKEWDEVMLDSYNLRVSLDETKKELAHALYQHDAACRVIARLVKENKNLQSLLKMT